MTIYSNQQISLFIADHPDPLLATMVPLQGVVISRLRLVPALIASSAVTRGSWQHRQSQSGRLSMQLTLQGVLDDAAAEQWLQHYALSAEHFNMELAFGNEHRLSGLCHIARFDRSINQYQPEQYEAVIVNAAALSYSTI